jgi:hypothetical protein
MYLTRIKVASKKCLWKAKEKAPETGQKGLLETGQKGLVKLVESRRDWAFQFL